MAEELEDSPKPKKAKKKGGKKKLLILLPVVLILIGGGVTAFLATKGIVKIPGLTPKKLMSKASALYGDKKEELVKKEEPKPKPKPKPKPAAPPKPPEPVIPEEQRIKGAEAVAEIWNAMPNDRVLAVAASWKDEDLARVLRLMEAEKTAALLAAMEPRRASRLSEEIQRQATPTAEG